MHPLPPEPTAMQDPQLKRLVAALDSAVEWAAASDAPEGLPADVEVARLRLQCLSRRLGASVAASPYLAYAERIVAQDSGRRIAVAASA